MTAKTLGVILITALALFTAVYWLTDKDRRDTRYEQLQAELVEYGKLVFGAAHARAPGGRQLRAVPRSRRHGRAGRHHRPPWRRTCTAARSTRSCKSNPDYVNLVIRYGGVVVSGNVNSPMPAWSTEVGGPLTIQQIDALTALVTSWADETGQQPVEQMPNTVEAGAQVFANAGCAGCHGHEPGGRWSVRACRTSATSRSRPSRSARTAAPARRSASWTSWSPTTTPTRATMLEKWIRDSATNYNDGTGDQHAGAPAASSRTTRCRR